jgi:hypothetical protein
MRGLLTGASAMIATLALTACFTRYDCGSSSIDGEEHGEWCGPLGSYGFLYIDEGMVSLLFTIDDNLDGDLDLADTYLPAWQAHFHLHLQPGTTVPAEGLLANCSRYQADYAYVTAPATEASVEIISEGGRAETGGHSWRMRWDVQCSQLGLYNEGSDLIELYWQSDGYDFDLYGVPSDYPLPEGEDTGGAW